MLTFRFTGARGEMVESEMLASGMVGKQIKFEFSKEWDGLRKAAVYRAGDISCTTMDVQEEDTIPAQVLSKALRRLYVGVYGISEDGRVVISTLYVPGPFIHIGAAVEDSAPDPEDPFWIRMEEAMEEAVRFTPQELTQEQKAQARLNIGVSGGGGLNAEAAALLISILRRAVYTEDLSGTISALETELEQAEEVFTYYAVTCNLENVTARPSSGAILQGESCSVVLTAASGYVLRSVTVTMGGKDITASVCSGSTVTIPAVTGNVVITAKAVSQTAEPEVSGEILYVAASVFDNVLNRYNEPSIRMSAVTTDVAADTPFPQNGTVYAGNLYLLPVPAGTNVLNVTSPGLIGGPQFFTLTNGVYTCALDAGWQTVDGFSYPFAADTYDFVAINFKNSDNTAFFTDDYDTSGMAIEFAAADSGGTGGTENPEKTEASVTLSLTNVSANNHQRTVTLGEAYKTVFVLEDGYILTSVRVTMGGKDITASVYSGSTVSIPAVTGDVVITAKAEATASEPEDTGGMLFVPAYLSGNQLCKWGYPSPRMAVVTTRAVADTPIPQDVDLGLGDLYLLPVPAGANVLKVTCPGLIGGPQFVNLSDGVYTTPLDVGYLEKDGFEYAFDADTYDFMCVNFKAADGSSFFTKDYDTSGVVIEFSVADSGGDDGEDSGSTEVTEVPITLSLTQTSVSNNQRTIAVGEKYATIFVPADGYYLSSVKVTMGGEDVTEQVYSNGTISIPVVTADILIMAVAVAEPGPVTISEIGRGTTSFVEGTGMLVNRNSSMTGRAMVIPVGQYLKKGTTYRFSLGEAASNYYFGVQIMVASTNGLTFNTPIDEDVRFSSVTSREVDTGWLQEDYTYTPTEHNRIFTVNFKRVSGEFSETHYAELLANVVIEEVTE